MLYRTYSNDRIAITQPTHAWVSGQLAQAWGNERMGSFAPYAAVCLGAEQHDIGWLPWEMAPTFNPKTGYPHSFMELPSEVHTQLWTKAKYLALPMNRYAALLVSLHGTGLYERFTRWKDSPTTTEVVEAFLRQEKAFQHEIINQLQQLSEYQAYVTPDVIARNQRLVAVWDVLSLQICMGITEPQSVEQVPAAQGYTTLTLTPIANDPTHLRVEPWCFRESVVKLGFEGRKIQPTPDAAAMQQQLATAPWVTLTTMLHPA